MAVLGAGDSARGAKSSALAPKRGASRAFWVGVDSFHDKRRAQSSACGPASSACGPIWGVRDTQNSAGRFGGGGGGVARGVEFQPVDLQHLGGEGGEVVLRSGRRGAVVRLREQGAGRGG